MKGMKPKKGKGMAGMARMGKSSVAMPGHMGMEMPMAGKKKTMRKKKGM